MAKPIHVYTYIVIINTADPTASTHFLVPLKASLAYGELLHRLRTELDVTVKRPLWEFLAAQWHHYELQHSYLNLNVYTERIEFSYIVCI